jgi:hypothetical protein
MQPGEAAFGGGSAQAPLVLGIDTHHL